MSKYFDLTDIKKIKPNPDNPRVIKDEAYKKLVKSIQDFPQMLELRPIVIDEAGVILGGNMRYRACIDAGMKKVPTVQADTLTEEQKREFIIKDNVGFGDWDWEALGNWDSVSLNEWGLNVPVFNDVSLEEFFETNNVQEAKPSTKIVLEYTESDYAQVIAWFNQRSGTKEQIVFNLLQNAE